MKPKLAILSDYAEENWPSMDLAAEMLLTELNTHHAHELDATMVCPAFKRRFSHLVRSNRGRLVDRLINRLHDYPRWIAKRANGFDLFHLADHSYSQLIHVLPAERTGVFCHDLDTFRCLLEPKVEPRPRWFRAMARRILEGMQKARVVFYSTNVVREQILQHGLIDPMRLVQAPCGVAPEFTPNPAPVALPASLDRAVADGYLLHVGSCIPRKRIDVLLGVFGAFLQSHPNLHLVQVGGNWTPEQLRQITHLGIADYLVQLSRQPRAVIAELYRRSRAVLVPSEAEGFGLPVVEALASGVPVIASDLPVLREVGGDAVIYCTIGDVPEWTARTDNLLREGSAPSQDSRLARAERYSWTTQANVIAQTYLQRFALPIRRAPLNKVIGR